MNPTKQDGGVVISDYAVHTIVTIVFFLYPYNPEKVTFLNPEFLKFLRETSVFNLLEAFFRPQSNKRFS
jgi:hypothetical protein